VVQDQPRQIVYETPSPNNQSKWTGGEVQAIEPLLCKCDALSSNSSPTKIKRERDGGEERKRERERERERDC
jgi:hypothetical protein